ncbi:MAG: hypothetical protein ABII27_07400 [bacterium]
MLNNKNISKTIAAGITALFVIGIIQLRPLLADDKSENKGSIKLEWQEFRSILKLDSDEIRLSMDEFNKLLLQTGSKNKPDYRIDAGNVVLSREQFKNLLAQMKPPKKGTVSPPAQYIMRKSEYTGIVGQESTQFTAYLDLEIFQQEDKTYIKIPLFREELAIKDIQIDGKPASVISDGSQHYINTILTGKHSIKAQFSVTSSLNKGSHGMQFSIPQTPITLLTLDIPLKDVDVTINGAQDVATEYKNKHTIVIGNLTPSSLMNISWNKKFDDKARGPAKVYAKLFHLISIEADVIQVTTKIDLNVLQNKISMLTILVPSSLNVLDVAGQGKSEWSIREEKGSILLEIPFEYPAEGDRNITIRSEKLLQEETTMADFTGFKVINTERETGYIAGVVESDAAAQVQEFKGLEAIDFQKLPPEITRLSARPIVFAFKYINHPFSVIFDITKYKKEEALTALIDNLKGLTLLKKDGKLVHQLTFTMRNLWNQFLKLELPENASIWSVYVDGKREKASKNESGKILIPLKRSNREGNLLKSFDVELIYTEPKQKLSFFGTKKIVLPSTDILINEIQWYFHLPVEYDYLNFKGNLDRENIIVPISGPQTARSITTNISKCVAGSASNLEDISIVSGVSEDEKETGDYMRKKGELRKDNACAKIPNEYRLKEVIDKVEYDKTETEPCLGVGRSNKPTSFKGGTAFPEEIAESYNRSGFDADKKLSLGLAGALSIRMSIPLSGKPFRFSKKIIEGGEPVALRFTYFNENIITWLIILFILAILIFIFKKRKMAFKQLTTFGCIILNIYPRIKKFFSPKILPLTVAAFFIIIVILNEIFHLRNYFPDFFLFAIIALFIFSIVRLFKEKLAVIIRTYKIPFIFLLIGVFFSFLAGGSRLFIIFAPISLISFICFAVSFLIIIVRKLRKDKKKDTPK